MSTSEQVQTPLSCCRGQLPAPQLVYDRSLIGAVTAGTLNLQGRQLVCQGLVDEDKAIWLSPERARNRCLVTRQPMRVWAATILRIVTDQFTTKTMPVDNLYSGEDVQGTGMLPWHGRQ